MRTQWCGWGEWEGGSPPTQFPLQSPQPATNPGPTKSSLPAHLSKEDVGGQPLLAGRRGSRTGGLEGCRGRSLDTLLPVEQARRPAETERGASRLGPAPPNTQPSARDRKKTERRRDRLVGREEVGRSGMGMGGTSLTFWGLFHRVLVTFRGRSLTP